MNAEVIYMFAYDVAREADLGKVAKLLSGSPEKARLGRPKDTPQDFPMHHPLAIQLEDIIIDGPSGPLHFTVSVKIFEFGAISLKLRLPVAAEKLSDLQQYLKFQFKGGQRMEELLVKTSRKVFDSIKEGLDNPVSELDPPEDFTVFCISAEAMAGPDVGSAGPDSESWMRRNAREVAGLLVGEADPSCLSQQEVDDVTKCWFSYYRRDLTVIDWDTALLVDIPEDYKGMLYVMEMANIQLEELKVYDMYLDQVLDKAYDEVERASRLKNWFSRQRMISELREIRMDLSKVTDEITNISKFFGEWHLARIYMGCASRFHLAEWENAVNEKLRALDSLYAILQHDTFNWVMFVLEAAIVVLFIIDLIIIIFLGM